MESDMHLSHEILYVIVAFLVGALSGMVFGICLVGAWLMGWLFPTTVPEHLANNDALGNKARSRVEVELPFAGASKYDFIRDEIGNVTYRPKL
jgi:polyferredoxin